MPHLDRKALQAQQDAWFLEAMPKPLSHAESQILLIRVALGLAPYHDVVEAVRILHDEGMEALERVRGPRSDRSADWRPREPVLLPTAPAPQS